MFETKYQRMLRNVGIKTAMIAVWWGSLALVGLLCETIGDYDAKYGLIVLAALLPVSLVMNAFPGRKGR